MASEFHALLEYVDGHISINLKRYRKIPKGKNRAHAGVPSHEEGNYPMSKRHNTGGAINFKRSY